MCVFFFNESLRCKIFVSFCNLLLSFWSCPKNWFSFDCKGWALVQFRFAGLRNVLFVHRIIQFPWRSANKTVQNQCYDSRNCITSMQVRNWHFYAYLWIVSNEILYCCLGSNIFRLENLIYRTMNIRVFSLRENSNILKIVNLSLVQYKFCRFVLQGNRVAFTPLILA